eukprot:TRINITY_DN47260_c0_g1_i1.p1 TRINITY_DN47260_c0_g1~~TRINITY_DN47260_c0_g1_i1.p1  ORF type:complete len:540 (-),score=140.40 TRINITY_DN47260_c0_g1_i1:63-1682(-)
MGSSPPMVELLGQLNEPMVDVEVMEAASSMVKNVCRKMLDPARPSDRNALDLAAFRVIRTPADVRAIGNLLSQRSLAPRIEKLFLMQQKLSPEFAQVLADGLQSNVALLECLDTLDVSTNTVGTAFGPIVAFARSANLSFNELKDAEASIYMQELRRIGVHKLHHLNLTGNSIGVQTCSALGTYLMNAGCRVKSLYLGWNSIGDAGIHLLCSSLISNRSVLTLDIGGNNVTDLGAMSIGDLLAKNHVIKTLSLSENQIGDIGAIHVSSGLASNTSLKTLLFTRNDVTQDGGIALGRALEMNSTLEHIDLRQNRLGPIGGGEAFGKALLVNTALKTLELRQTGLGDAGCQFLANVLKTHQHLENLNIRKNDVGPEGAICIGQMIQENKSLVTLEMRENPRIGQIGIFSVIEALGKNVSLQSVDIRWSGADHVSVRSALCSLHQNLVIQEFLIHEHWFKKNPETRALVKVLKSDVVERNQVLSERFSVTLLLKFLTKCSTDLSDYLDYACVPLILNFAGFTPAKIKETRGLGYNLANILQD